MAEIESFDLRDTLRAMPEEDSGSGERDEEVGVGETTVIDRASLLYRDTSVSTEVRARELLVDNASIIGTEDCLGRCRSDKDDEIEGRGWSIEEENLSITEGDVGES